MKNLSAAIACILSTAAFAQTSFPDHPLRLVVPFTPGGNADIVARIVAQGMSEELKQPIVVENKPGANAAIGATEVARAKPDGYTMLFGTAETHALNPHLRKGLSYDPIRDLPAVGVIDWYVLGLVLSPKLPGTLKEFVAVAKQSPGKMNFASWGNGSVSQIAFEQLKQSAGIDLVHVPFQGAAPAITAVAADNVQAFIVPLSLARPQAAQGRVKLVAVMSDKKEDAAPEVPTAAEQGLRGARAAREGGREARVLRRRGSAGDGEERVPALGRGGAQGRHPA